MSRIRACAIFVAALLVPFCAWPQGTVSSAERDLFALINRDRQAQGLRPLRWDDNLTTAARQHSQEMARHGALSHQFPGEPSLSTRARQSGVHYAWLSENVDQGHDSRSLNDQWMNSPPHRGNILDKDMDSVGVGVVESRGLLWATADFSQAK